MNASIATPNSPAGAGYSSSALEGLLPCPFCGHAPELVENLYGEWCREPRRYAAVKCRNLCCAVQPTTQCSPQDPTGQNDVWASAADAVAAWNRRPNGKTSDDWDRLEVAANAMQTKVRDAHVIRINNGPWLDFEATHELGKRLGFGGYLNLLEWLVEKYGVPFKGVVHWPDAKAQAADGA